MSYLQKNESLEENLKISSINTGFIEIPDNISLNIYVQGCKLRCKNCHNSELQDFNGGKDITTSDFDLLLKRNMLAEWVVWLGGDAVYQPEAFKNFNKIAKNNSFKICLYTGLYKNDLDETLLENVDLLFDGPYVEELGTPDKSNSSNQKIYIKINKQWINVTYDELKERIKEV